MNQQTANRLAALNRRFYLEHARSFDRTRRSGWAGWTRLLEETLAIPPARASGALRVLDAGCGNARFATHLAEQLSRTRAGSSTLEAMTLHYFGLDWSVPLLAAAGRRCSALAGRFAFAAADLLVETGCLRVAPPERQAFGVVAAFGLLHHVPALEARRRLLRDLAAQCGAGGVLLLSFWQLDQLPDLAKRTLTWEEHNRTTPEPIDLDQLEAGDRLLRWGEDPSPSGPRRYCHQVDELESESLVAALGFRTVARFRADGRSGRLNLYLALQRPAESGF